MEITIKFDPSNENDIKQLLNLGEQLSLDLIGCETKQTTLVDVDDSEPKWMSGDSDTDTDADGVKWDERIHASTKRKNSDGTWTRKRGVSQELVDSVLAEIAGQQDLLATPELVFTPPNVAHVDTPPVIVAPPAPVSLHTIEEINNEVTSRIVLGELAPTDLGTVLAKHGLTKITDLVSRPDLVDAVWNDLCL